MADPPDPGQTGLLDPTEPVDAAPPPPAASSIAGSDAGSGTQRGGAASTGKRDRAPKKKDPKRVAAGRKGREKQLRGQQLTTAKIEAGLTELLTLPAVAYSIAGMDWPAQHVTQQGPELAHHLAVQSERNATLRGWCERLLAGESAAVLLFASFSYLAPQLMYFGLLPAPPAVAAMYGIPPRPGRPQPEPPAATDVFGDPAPAGDTGGDAAAAPPTDQAA